MRPLSVEEMIGVWEQGELRSPVDQALLLLHAASPKESLSDLAKLRIGRRDGHLLELREKTFGMRLSCSVVCPHCSENLQFEFETRQVLQPVEAEQADRVTFTMDDLTVAFRLPNSEDLMEAMKATSAKEARRRLLTRCLLQVQLHGNDLTPSELPDSMQEKISDIMGAADPQADLRFTVECLPCGKSWQAPFDIVSFLWKEVAVRAQRALSEVHVLAAVYGWGEQEILSMSAARREFYLQMVNG